MSNNHRTSRHRTVYLTVSVLLLGCTPKAGLLGELGDSTGGNGGDGTQTDSFPPNHGTQGDSAGSATDGTSTETPCCGETVPCAEDKDRDDVHIDDDNAPHVYNPSQMDQDVDGLGDAVDLCPIVASDPQNTADSDKDGIGNACDRCGETLAAYNASAEDLALPASMRVRNVPITSDADADGVGDACDNCVVVANCGDWGSDNPHQLGTETPDLGPQCQRDDDQDMVGDACQGMTVTAHAAGPIALGPTDDFDQDGVRNEVDGCPRLPLSQTLECSAAQPCPDGRACAIDGDAEHGICDHVDTDQDSVGDRCDTCSVSANPMQVIDGEGQADDEDGDFVGAACETAADCTQRPDPLRIAYRAVAVEGLCCNVQLVVDDDGWLRPAHQDLSPEAGEVLLDPDGVPLRLDCSPQQEENHECRALPPVIAQRPGLVELPPGCEEALAEAGMTASDNRQLGLGFHGDVQDVHAHACLLPQLDSDFDGLGDACDLCPFSFDPGNARHIDGDGTLYPDLGAMCNGEYAFGKICR